ncbi:MAG TPA: hypothetical protein PKY81_02005 [bacterium]|nr:hypothetical protein [bacterium]
MKLSNTQIICVCIFAAMWSAVEIFLGSLLHQIPGKPIPTAMAAMIFAIPILTLLYEITQNVETIILAGCITAILKVFSPGGVKITPFVSILLETGIFAAIIFVIPDTFKKLKIFAAGIAASVGGSVIGGLFGAVMFGLFNTETRNYILILFAKKFGTGLLGGIIGALIAVSIISRLNRHPLFKNREK